MKKLIAGIAAVVCSLGLVGPARAGFCSVPTPLQVVCGGTDGCSQTVYKYFCSGYAATQYTCGASWCGSPPITRCGNVVGHKKMYSDQMCVGCEKTKKQLALTDTPDEIEPRSATTEPPEGLAGEDR